MPPYPPQVSDFKAYFVRDFNYAPSDDQNNLNTYVVDADVQRAINEANINFNQDLFDTSSIGMIFMYLAAYTLIENIQNSSQGISSQVQFPITSNSVGGVAINFQIPERYMKDAFLQQYTKNGYGYKYLELVLPYLVGVASAGLRRTSTA